ncbi:hypothetical protein SESBI_31015 [Sesbania bispinosa]|nr:hypothetical protein SESBI_31015 [Sesbania bispinosa]
MGRPTKKIGQRAKNEIQWLSTASHSLQGSVTWQVKKKSKKGNTIALSGIGNGEDEKGKVELLKALHASQTRAREAEKKISVLRKERDGLSIALLEEAMQLFAYRQHVRLLELQVLNLQSLWLQQQQPAMSGCCARQREGDVGLSNENGHDDEEHQVLVVSHGFWL